MNQKTTALTNRLRNGDFMTAPGVFDLISARIADQFEFPAIYMTGYGVVASSLGLPDAGLASYTEMVDRVEKSRWRQRHRSSPTVTPGMVAYLTLITRSADTNEQAPVVSSWKIRNTPRSAAILQGAESLP